MIDAGADEARLDSTEIVRIVTTDADLSDTALRLLDKHELLSAESSRESAGRAFLEAEVSIEAPTRVEVGNSNRHGCQSVQRHVILPRWRA
jgi:hypothetical protein